MILDKHKSTHLLLLVGGNPLPNAVAGKLLLKEEGQITLIHSSGEHGTGSIAGNLADWFDGQGIKNINLVEVDESDGRKIYNKVARIVKDEGGQVGLNYTGGTKVMAVYAYDAVKSWEYNNDARATYSYLNARTLQMVFADGGKTYVGVHPDFSLMIEQLFALHGWTFESSTPLPELTGIKITPTFDLYQGRGKKFEQDIVQEILTIKEKQKLKIQLNVFARKGDVLSEFDIIILRGYQLFLLSCTIINPDRAKWRRNRPRVKSKLFEAFIRARQLGGDEACAALVCFWDEPLLEKEIQQILQVKGRVRVFGQRHLHDFQTYLTAWIKEQSKED